MFPALSSNFATLKDELSRAVPRPEALNVVSLLNAASEMLASVGADWRREVVIVSDFQRTNWATADFAVLPKDTLIKLESVAPREPASNLAVLNVSTQGRIEVGRPVRLQVEIGNYSPTSRQVRVDLRFGRAHHAAARRQRGCTVRTAWKGLACRTRRQRCRRMSFPANSVGLSATRR